MRPPGTFIRPPATLPNAAAVLPSASLPCATVIRRGSLMSWVIEPSLIEPPTVMMKMQLQVSGVAPAGSRGQSAQSASLGW